MSEDEITGTSKHVSSYPGFSGSEEEQEGNFLALSLKANEGVTISTELLNGTHGAVEVTDGFCVYRITDKDQQSMKVTFETDGAKIVKTYGLSGLDCQKD